MSEIGLVEVEFDHFNITKVFHDFGWTRHFFRFLLPSFESSWKTECDYVILSEMRKNKQRGKTTRKFEGKIEFPISLTAKLAGLILSQIIAPIWYNQHTKNEQNRLGGCRDKRTLIFQLNEISYLLNCEAGWFDSLTDHSSNMIQSAHKEWAKSAWWMPR